MTNHLEILGRWRLLSPYLNRQQQAFWAAAEAELIGYGGCTLLAKVTGIAPATIARRKRQCSVTGSAAAGSLIPKRSAGAGRKATEVNHPEIEPALQQMLSEEIADDPMSAQRWVRSSLRNLSKRLGEQGHQACTHTVARLLRKMGYSLQVAKKKQAGAQHPDRDEQFKYIAMLKAEFLTKKLPLISIDTKKKELIGNYRREGKTWRRQPLEVDLLRKLCTLCSCSVWDLRCGSKHWICYCRNLPQHRRIRGQLFSGLVAATRTASIPAGEPGAGPCQWRRRQRIQSADLENGSAREVVRCLWIDAHPKSLSHRVLEMESNRISTLQPHQHELGRPAASHSGCDARIHQRHNH